MSFFWRNLGLKFPSTVYGVKLFWFHSYLCSWLLGVLLFVSLVIYGLFFFQFYFKIVGAKYLKSELMCSCLPALVILTMLIPSLNLLYTSTLLEGGSELTLKVVAHQWYWSYGYCDIGGLEFDSFMKSIDDLQGGDYRLMEVDRRVVLPSDVVIRICFTSADVIHSWTLPSAGVKVDCMPGVLNSVTMKYSLGGVHYGQCSEICGANHTFMPIVVEVTSWQSFFVWVKEMLQFG